MRESVIQELPDEGTDLSLKNPFFLSGRSLLTTLLKSDALYDPLFEKIDES